MSKAPEHHAKEEPKHEAKTEPKRETVTLEEAKPTKPTGPASLPKVDDLVRAAAPIYAQLIGGWPNATEGMHEAMMGQAIRQVLEMHAMAEKLLAEAKESH